MVIPDAPVKAVKMAQSKRDTTAMPPGIQLKYRLVRAKRRSGALLSARRIPVKMNRGSEIEHRGVR